MMENHTGQSGPRTELLELLDWLRRLRRRQRFLGFKESDLTYLYDIPTGPQIELWPIVPQIDR